MQQMQLLILHVHKGNILMVTTQQKKAPPAAKHKISGLTKQDIVKKYPSEVFQREVRRLEGKLKLEVDDTVQAVRLL